MIVKILSSASNDFHGVKYNEKKIDSGAGELIGMKNFPERIDGEKAENVREYLKFVSDKPKSNNRKVKNPQFHATISTKYQEHSKEELGAIAENFMQEMGYGNQPYIVVFHGDTENNHIHIVSTRVDKDTGRKINDSYERLKSQRALQKAMKEVLGEGQDKVLEELTKYKISSFNQLALVLERSGYKIEESKEDDNTFDIFKNGVHQMKIAKKDISFSPKLDKEEKERKKQLWAILNKYKEHFSNKVFKVVDNREAEGKAEDKSERQIAPKIEFESELQEQLRKKFGIDIVFSHKNGKTPFGYTLIDHSTRRVYKGSDIMKMNELFEFTDKEIDKREFERLKDFSLPTEEHRQAFIQYIKANQEKWGNVEDFMVFENKKRISKETYTQARKDTLHFIKTKNATNPSSDGDVAIIGGENGKYYAFHSKLHQFQELESLIGQKAYSQYVNNQEGSLTNIAKDLVSGVGDVVKAVADIAEIAMKPTGGSGGSDPFENELKKRRKKRR